jgi:hypothetical protein
MEDSKSLVLDDHAPTINCLICKGPLTVKLAHSESGNITVTLICSLNGRHFRAFIADKEFVQRVMEKAEGKA